MDCCYKNKSLIGKFYIIDQNVDPIFAHDWIIEVKQDFVDIFRNYKAGTNFVI